MNKPIKYDDLQYYFDAQVKDAIDNRSLCDRSRRLNNLVTRLLQMPKSEFDTIVQTLDQMISTKTTKQSSPTSDTSSGQLAALELYQSTAPTEGGVTSKISAV